MVRQMERSTVHMLAKRGQRIRQIAAALGRSPTTMARVLKEPVDQPPTRRQHRSKIEIDRPHIARWIEEGLSTVRLLELARRDLAQPYRGGRTVFGDLVRRIRQGPCGCPGAAASSR